MIREIDDAANSALRSYFETSFNGLFVEALKHKAIRLEKVVLADEAKIRAITSEAANAAINVLVTNLG